MSEQSTGAVGMIRIDALEITITPLKQSEERALRRRLLKEAAEAAGDYFTRCAKLLAAMRSQPGAYLKAIETITTLTATGPTVSEDQLYEYRESPAGVALELYVRGKKATPGLELAGLRAIVTDANVDELIESLREVLEGAAPKNSPTP